MKHGTYYASLNERQLASVWRIQKSLYGEGNSFDELKWIQKVENENVEHSGKGKIQEKYHHLADRGTEKSESCLRVER